MESPAASVAVKRERRDGGMGRGQPKRGATKGARGGRGGGVAGAAVGFPPAAAARGRGGSGATQPVDVAPDSPPLQGQPGRNRAHEMAAAAREAVDDGAEAGAVPVDSYVRMRARKQCSCIMLKRFYVGPLRALCKHPRVMVDTKFIDSESGRPRLLPKKLLLLRLCVVCETLEEVANANDDDVEGVEHTCWFPPTPDPSALSVCDAYHLFFVAYFESNDLAAESPIRYELNRFRAHTLKHLRTNWVYYVKKGRQNREGGE